MQLKQWREQRGLKMSALADKLGCHRSQILRIERGTQKPSTSLLRAIFKFTHGAVGPSDFYEFHESDNVHRR